MNRILLSFVVWLLAQSASAHTDGALNDTSLGQVEILERSFKPDLTQCLANLKAAKTSELGLDKKEAGTSNTVFTCRIPIPLPEGRELLKFSPELSLAPGSDNSTGRSRTGIHQSMQLADRSTLGCTVRAELDSTEYYVAISINRYIKKDLGSRQGPGLSTMYLEVAPTAEDKTIARNLILTTFETYVRGLSTAEPLTVNVLALRRTK